MSNDLKNSSVKSQAVRRSPVAFLDLLPAIQTHTKISFRHLDTQEKEEAVQEVIANSFVAYQRLCSQRKYDQIFASALASFAIRHYYAGRKVGTSQAKNDVLSASGQARNGIRVQSITPSDDPESLWRQMVIEDRKVKPDELAATRIDLSEWLKSLSIRNRRIAESLMNGEASHRIAKLFQVTAARICQIRNELMLSWYRFHGIPVAS